MEDISWGLLGPEVLPSSRRTRPLGLGASVRQFNDLAVPGLGGVWFGKQLLLASLGVAVAEQARNKGAKVQNIEVANAIEALACWLAFDNNRWTRDPRLRGNTKLQGKGDDFSFARARQRNFYVTQPMRMATVQALPALGFVDASSARFNAFRCSAAGTEFVEHACKDFRPCNRSVTDHLTLWACRRDHRVKTDALRSALSPLAPLSDDTRRLLRERLLQGGDEGSEAKQRRSNALAWVEEIRSRKPAKPGRDTRPKWITGDHWHDLMAGARFFNTRDAAIAVLDALEAYIGNQASGRSYSLRTAIPESLVPLLTELQAAAQAFLETKHSNRAAKSFCDACVASEASQVLRSLVERDGQVLRLGGDEVKPGPVFRGTALAQDEVEGEASDFPAAAEVPLPEGISYRVHNLYLLNLDMHGELDRWLKPAANAGRQ